MVELLHDGNLLLDEVEAAQVLGLAGRVPVQRGVEAEASGEGALAAAAGAGAAEEVRLGALAEARLGELLDGLGASC